jgi:hypothetical protein
MGTDSNCPAKLLVFDLNSDVFLFKIEIPNNFGNSKNKIELLVTPIVETYGDTCDNTTVILFH